MGAVRYLSTALSAVGCTLYAVSGILYVLDRLPAKWYYAARMVADGCCLAQSIILMRLETQRFSLLIPLFVGLFALDWWMWRKHKDDDDDWGDRVRSWVRSHIPRPRLVQIRPIGAT